MTPEDLLFYVCKFCGRTDANKEAIWIHEREAHQNTSEDREQVVPQNCLSKKDFDISSLPLIRYQSDVDLFPLPDKIFESDDEDDDDHNNNENVDRERNNNIINNNNNNNDSNNNQSDHINININDVANGGIKMEVEELSPQNKELIILRVEGALQAQVESDQNQSHHVQIHPPAYSESFQVTEAELSGHPVTYLDVQEVGQQEVKSEGDSHNASELIANIDQYLDIFDAAEVKAESPDTDPDDLNDIQIDPLAIEPELAKQITFGPEFIPVIVKEPLPPILHRADLPGQSATAPAMERIKVVHIQKVAPNKRGRKPKPKEAPSKVVMLEAAGPSRGQVTQVQPQNPARVSMAVSVSAPPPMLKKKGRGRPPLNQQKSASKVKGMSVRNVNNLEEEDEVVDDDSDPDFDPNLPEGPDPRMKKLGRKSKPKVVWMNDNENSNGDSDSNPNPSPSQRKQIGRPPKNRANGVQTVQNSKSSPDNKSKSKSKSGKEKNHECAVCGKKFALKHHLTAHHAVHTGERNFPCSHCGRAFTQQGTVIIHERIHTGERPYPCLLCPGKNFISKCALVSHEKHHHR